MRRVLLLCCSESRAGIGKRIEDALRAARLEVDVRDSSILTFEVKAYTIVVTDAVSLPPLEWTLASGLRGVRHALHVLTAPGREIFGIVRAKEILDEAGVRPLYSDTIEALASVVSEAAQQPIAQTAQ